MPANFQVISLHVRSNLDEGKGIIVSKDPNFDVDDAKHSLNKEEINYLYVLNKLLPNEIRVIGWTPVSLDFKARCERVSTYSHLINWPQI